MHMLHEGKEAPQRHDQAKKNVSHFWTLRATYFLIQTISKALVRDAFRCMASGRYDHQSVLKNVELKNEAWSSRSPTCDTQCAHIFPQSINMGTSGSSNDGAKVCTHVPSISAIAHFLARTSMPRLCGRF